jgi:hypothetical protein
MKKIFLSNWPLILIVALSFLITWPLFLPGYFSHHDSLQVMRIFEMRKCFADFQIPCRWVPDMGFGFGYPLFNFYGVMPYYLGAIFSFVVGYIGAAKLLFFLPLILSGIGMYLLAKELFGKIPGVVAGVLYLFAPYRALDVYVRGDVGESFALALFPFVFYFFLKLIKLKNKKYFLLATFTMFLFLITHNIMILIFTPVILVWITILLLQENWKGIKIVLISLSLAFGLSAFFILPAFFEKNLVQTDSLIVGELNFRNQFVKISQLFFDRSWNYSGSNPQSKNTISYQIGWPHWMLVVCAGLIFFLNKNKKNILLFIFLFSIFSLGIFMTHNKSAPFWEAIKILAFVQFPWRFLSFAIFGSSLLGGYFISYLNKKWLTILSVIIIILTVLFNWQYFKPEHFFYDLTDQKLLSGKSFVDQQKGALLDYLPKTALEPREPAPKLDNFVNTSHAWQYLVKIDKNTIITIPAFDFQGWTTNYPHKTDKIGRIVFELPAGEYILTGKFENTPIRTLGNTLTLISFITLILIYAKGRKLFI